MAVEVFNSAGKKLKENGATLVYHPHGYEFRPYEDSTLMDYMIKESQYFDFEMDVYWFAHPGEDPIAWLRRYPKEFKLMHLKDCEKGTKGNQNGQSDVETNVVLGTGQIDIAAIVSEAKKMRLEYLFIEDESSKSEVQIPISKKYLETIIQELSDMKKITALVLTMAFGIAMSGQEIGLQLYSLRNQFKTDVPGTLKIINDWGITNLEGGGTYGLPMEEFQGLLKKNNLDVVSVGAGYDDLKAGKVDKIIENAKGLRSQICHVCLDIT